MIEYFPAEFLVRWNKNSENEIENVPQQTKFIYSSEMLVLEAKSLEEIKEQVNDFVYTNVFLGKKIGNISCSAHDEAGHFLVRKLLINNPFVEKCEQILSNSIIKFSIQFKHKQRIL
jgi:hypothetical protein